MSKPLMQIIVGLIQQIVNIITWFIFEQNIGDALGQLSKRLKKMEYEDFTHRIGERGKRD